MNEVRHEQQAIRLREQSRALLLESQQLEQCVERLELGAGQAEDFGARHFPERLFDHAVGAGVAIMEAGYLTISSPPSCNT